MSYTDLRKNWESWHEKERPQREAWAHPAMLQISRLVMAMEDAGWRRIMYCPQDGRYFLGWEPSYSTPFVFNMSIPDGGSWCDATYMAFMDGDAWPVHPTHFKELPEGVEFYSEANAKIKARAS